MLRAVVVVLALLSGVRPAAAQRPRDSVRTAFAELQQKYAQVVRSHPEIYGHYPVVELVTMGIGSLIWERHGHIALCIRYQDPSQDTCYNYGIGDFHEPMKMATGFFRGTKSFWVGPQEPYNMFGVYLYGDRTIWVQPLPLTDQQEKDVISKLEYDILEDHKHYAYDHFWDNCTTRVRDVLDKAIGGELHRFAAAEPIPGPTYRDLARKGFFGMRIPLIITDIAMGRVTDRVPSYWERMFLPDYMRDAAAKYWKMEPQVIYQRKGPPPLDDGPSGRLWFALIILALTAPAWATKLWGKFERTGLAVSVLPYVFLGSVFWFLALVSPLPYVESNESCLVLLPCDLLLVWFLSPAKRRLYARIRVGSIALVALLLLVNVLHQPIWPLLLWPLVPSAVVGFWPPRASAKS
jgi:hypothetical protein